MKSKLQRQVDELETAINKRWEELQTHLTPELREEFTPITGLFEEMFKDMKGIAELLSWTPVKSSNLRSARYHPEAKLLEVVFRGSGQVYEYHDVPPDAWDVLNNAGDISIGRWFNMHIKRNYACSKRVKE